MADLGNVQLEQVHQGSVQLEHGQRDVQQHFEGASEDRPSSGSPPSPRQEAPAWKGLRRRWTEKTLPSSQYREGDASLVDVEAGVGALLEPPESKSTWQDGSRMDRVKNWKNYEGLTNHPLHVVVEGLLGLARSSSLTDRVVFRQELGQPIIVGISVGEMEAVGGVSRCETPWTLIFPRIETMDSSLFVFLHGFCVCAAHLAFLCARPLFLKVGSWLRFSSWTIYYEDTKKWICELFQYICHFC